MEGDNGWESLLVAKSEYVANVQRMLRSACQNAASLNEADSACGGNLPAMTPIAQLPARHDENISYRIGANINSSHIATGQDCNLQPFQVPVPQLRRPQSPPLPADEGAGSYAFEKLTLVEDASTGSTAVNTAKGSGGSLGGVGVIGSGNPSMINGCRGDLSPASTLAGSAAKVEEVANEVLRLRLLKSQHEELRLQLVRAEAQMRRLSPHAVFQLRSYFERNFKEAHLALQVQEALVRMLECLCTVSRIEVSAWTPDNLLASAKKLFRDPHNFTSRLCSMPQITGEEAKGLAPFLTSSTQFRRVREKEVNECYDAFYTWLSAFYLYSVVSDQVGPTAEALERQEWVLRRLIGQADDPGPFVRPNSFGTQQPNTLVASPTSTESRGGLIAQANNSVGSSHGANRGRRVDARGSGVASPLGRSRAMLQGGSTRAPNQRPGAVSSNARTDGPGSRSPSPGVRAAGSGLRTRPGCGPSSCLNEAVPHPSRTNTATSPSARQVMVPSCASSGLCRVQSEKSIGRSPRPQKKESRSPSPGTGRASPTAPLPPRALGSRVSGTDKRLVRQGDGRAISPSRSEGSLSIVQRMVSAPADSHRSVAVRTKTSPSTGARVGSGYGLVNRPAVATTSGVRRRTSPDKLSRSERHFPDATPRSGIESAPRDSARSARGDDGSINDEDDDDGPRRRRLSAKQYEALVRCAQHVVAVSAVPPPAPVANSQAPKFNNAMATAPGRCVEVKTVEDES